MHTSHIAEYATFPDVETRRGIGAVYLAEKMKLYLDSDAEFWNSDIPTAHYERKRCGKSLDQPP